MYRSVLRTYHRIVIVNRIKKLASVLKEYAVELAKEYSQDNVAQLSAALAYYATFSIVPALIIGISVGGMVFGEETTRERVFAELSIWMNADSLDFVRRAIERSGSQPKSSGIWATVISIGVLFVGSTQFFAQLQEALNRVWEVRPTRQAFWDVVRKRLLSFVLIGTMGLVLLASMLASTTVAAVGKFAEGLIPFNLHLVELLNSAATFGVGTVLFSLIYRMFPDVRVAWRDVWGGAMLTTGALIAAKYGMGVYLGRSAFASGYGAAGSMIVFLFWVYVSANIVLMGAEFCQVHARRLGREIEPHSKAETIWNRSRGNGNGNKNAASSDEAADSGSVDADEASD